LYGIGSSAGEIIADHARSHALGLEDRFIPLTPGYCARLLQVSTRSQKSDMSSQERGRSVVSGSLILIDDYIPSMAPWIRKYVPGRGHRCSLAERLTGLHLALGLKSIVLSRQCFG
jgi:hypothetical protein